MWSLWSFFAIIIWRVRSITFFFSKCNLALVPSCWNLYLWKFNFICKEKVRCQIAILEEFLIRSIVAIALVTYTIATSVIKNCLHFLSKKQKLKKKVWMCGIFVFCTKIWTTLIFCLNYKVNTYYTHAIISLPQACFTT